MIKAGVVSSEVEPQLKWLLEQRNWLVHNSRHENPHAVYSDEATYSLIVRLQTIEENARTLMHEISSMTETYVIKFGVLKSEVDDLTNEILEQWHRGG